MAALKLKLIKLGGSVLTFKEKPLLVRREVLSSLVAEIRDVLLENNDMRLVLVHGGGSFGHYIVRKCLNIVGRIDDRCFSEAAFYMSILNNVVVRELLSSNLMPITIPPHAIFKFTSDGSLQYDLKIIKDFMEKGFIPILYGDVVLCSDGYKVLSGDTIAWVIAKELNVKEIVFVTDVDGIYNKDPKKYEDAILLERVKAYELMKLDLRSSNRYDVTGSMEFKLLEGVKLGVNGVIVKVINGLIKGNLFKALNDEDFVGTVVEY